MIKNMNIPIKNSNSALFLKFLSSNWVINAHIGKDSIQEGTKNVEAKGYSENA
jgi:hypothetical protein